MSDFCIWIAMIILFALPVMVIVLAIRAIMKKPIKTLAKSIGFNVGLFFALVVVSALSSPTMNCEHEYVKVDEIEATCYETGVITNECSLCGMQTTENTPPNHVWVSVNNSPATCTEDGYVLESCDICKETRKNVTEKAKNHTMKLISEREPTYENGGERVSRCTLCGYEDAEKLDKLKIEPIDFNGFHIEFGGYSFTEVDNPFYELHGTPVVKIQATITNNTSSPAHLNGFDFQLFNSSGKESEKLYFFFEDDVFGSSDVLPGKSYTKYFHIAYDGDGIYTIYFEEFFERKTVEIHVKKS